MSKTDVNLEFAYKCESQTRIKYRAFAKKAQEEGFPNLARLFRVAAEAETIHALNQIDAMGGVRSTKENLESAIKGEECDADESYPKFINEAREENRSEAVISFTWVRQVEEIHKRLYRKALESLQNGSDIEKEEYYVCTNCGFPSPGVAPKTCSVCGAPAAQFKKVR
jgi:rubrerythrin